MESLRQLKGMSDLESVVLLIETNLQSFVQENATVLGSEKDYSKIKSENILKDLKKYFKGEKEFKERLKSMKDL